jgi:hypothetical protein
LGVKGYVGSSRVGDRGHGSSINIVSELGGTEEAVK